MRVVYKKPIWESLNAAISEARNLHMTIDYIELTKQEYRELEKYCCGTLYSMQIPLAHYNGVKLVKTPNP
jgi:hypothetical protein